MQLSKKISDVSRAERVIKSTGLFDGIENFITFQDFVIRCDFQKEGKVFLHTILSKHFPEEWGTSSKN